MLLFIFKSVLVCSLVGTALFALSALLRPLTEKHFSSSWHYITGLLIILIMICPIRAEKPLNEEVKINNTVIEEKNDKIETVSHSYNFVTESTVKTAESKNLFLIGEKILSYIWLSFFGVLFITRHIKYRLFILKLLRNTNIITDINVPADTKLRIRRGKIISSPMVTGVFFPTLYLPEKDFSREELKLILSHEIIHLQRRDLIAKRLILFVRCVHFFNPAVHLLAKRIELDCEISCDLAATEKMSGEEKKHYMMTLLQLAPRFNRQQPLAAAIVSGKETLKRRFTKIISREKISKKTKLASAFLAVILITVSLCVSGVLASGIEKPEKESKNSNIETTLPLKNKEPASADEKDTVTQAQKSDKPDIVPTTVETTKSESTEVLSMPCAWTKITSEFGTWKKGDKEIFHDGVDFIFSQSSDVFASADGRVEFSGWDKENNYEDGISVVIVTDAGTKLIYKHLDSVSVSVGDQVRAGEIIAKSGSTGSATGLCLHFSVVRNGKYVDPMEYFR